MLLFNHTRAAVGSKKRRNMDMACTSVAEMGEPKYDIRWVDTTSAEPRGRVLQLHRQEHSASRLEAIKHGLEQGFPYCCVSVQTKPKSVGSRAAFVVKKVPVGVGDVGIGLPPEERG